MSIMTIRMPEDKHARIKQLALAEEGTLAADVPGAAMQRYQIDMIEAAPWQR